jgi:hypothetical protein
MSQKTFIINSADRLNEGTNRYTSDFNYAVQAFTNQLSDIYVESVQMYNTSYTVNEFNNEFCWQIITSGPFPMLVTHYLNFNGNAYGYYDINELIDLIETKMNLEASNGEVYSISINNATNTLQISCDLFSMTLLNTSNTLWKRLGFTNAKLGNLYTSFYDPSSSIEFNAWLIESGLSIYAYFTPKLSTNYYKILMSGISADTIDSKQQHQCIAIVPNNSAFGSLLDYQPQILKKYELPSTFAFNKINFKVLDDENNLANLNTDFSIVIVAHTSDYKCGCK